MAQSQQERTIGSLLSRRDWLLATLVGAFVGVVISGLVMYPQQSFMQQVGDVGLVLVAAVFLAAVTLGAFYLAIVLTE